MVGAYQGVDMTALAECLFHNCANNQNRTTHNRENGFDDPYPSAGALNSAGERPWASYLRVFFEFLAQAHTSGFAIFDCASQLFTENPGADEIRGQSKQHHQHGRLRPWISNDAIHGA